MSDRPEAEHSLRSRQTATSGAKSATSGMTGSKSVTQSSTTSSRFNQKCVLLHVERGEVFKNFESGWGKMDLYIIVEKTDANGYVESIGRTFTHWDGHFAPHWDWTSRVFEYESGEALSFTLYEDDMVGIDTKCGVATCPLDELLGDHVNRTLTRGDALSGNVRKLDFLNKGERIGVLLTSATIMMVNSSETFLMSQVTKANTGDFEDKCKRLSVSGGTAPFFKLTLKNGASFFTDDTGVKSPYHFIGKDLGHAKDEVQFYEEAKRYKGEAGLGAILRYAFEYGGVLTTKEDDDTERDLLVLRNLHDGCKRLRLLDVKIGQRTAQAGWQGKSRSAALRQLVVDGITNSSAEGFRLEGFDGMPSSLKSMDPLLDVGKAGTESKTAKKCRRVMFQRMSGLEMFMHFLDTHQEPGISPQEEHLNTHLSATEYAEIAFQQVVIHLIMLSLACRQVSIPQKWIGSSVAMGFDVAPESVPKRTPEAEKAIREGTRVHIFDWGRSELNTIKKFADLNEKERRDRSKYWTYYVGGVTRLAWDAARVYWHRFCNTQGWDKFYISVVDFDSLLPDDFIGRVVLEPIEDMEEITMELTPCGGSRHYDMSLHSKKPSLTLSVRWVAFPDSSRLKGAWSINIRQAQNLPRYDKVLLKTTSDPFVEVTAVSDKHVFRQRTSVKVAELSPVWDETLHVPVARGESGEEVMNMVSASTGVDWSHTVPSNILLPEHRLGYANTFCCAPTKARTQALGQSGASLEEARARWEDLLDHAPRTTSENILGETEKEFLNMRRALTMELRKQDSALLEAEVADVETPAEASTLAEGGKDDEPKPDTTPETVPQWPGMQLVPSEKQASDKLVVEESNDCIEQRRCGDRGCRTGPCRCQ